MYFKNEFFHGASYQRLHAVASVLERFVAGAPGVIGIGKLIDETDLPVSEARKICANLSALELIAVTGPEQWALVGAPGDITLEDVWQVAMLDQKPVRKSAAANGQNGAANDIDLLIAQALLAINQSISAHLRKCQLDRVKASHCGFCVALD